MRHGRRCGVAVAALVAGSFLEPVATTLTIISASDKNDMTGMPMPSPALPE